MRSKVSFSRRQFVSTLALSAGPLLLPAWSGAAAPSNRIHIACIGMGPQGRGIMNGLLRKPAAQVVAVCDADANRREDARQRVNSYYEKEGGGAAKGCLVFEDYRELVQRRDIDAVVVATPDHWHALITIAAAEAGKDIYCEKPLSKSIHESQAMVKAVRKNRRVLQVGSMQRSSREFRVACELVRNGRLGKIERVEVGVGGPAVPCDLPEEPAEPGLNWDLWLGPAPVRPYHSALSPRGVHGHFPQWRRYREYGGGGVCDFGAHHFDIAHWGLGMDGSGPREIIPPPDWEQAKSGVRLRYENGVDVFHIAGNGIRFIGQEGVVKVDRGRIEVTIGSRSIPRGELPLRDQLDQIEAEFLQPAKVRLYNSSHHLEDWLAAMQSRRRPICDVETGASTANVCHLVNLAYYHGQRMKWSPAREKFVDGTGDPGWLDVPHRRPWSVV